MLQIQYRVCTVSVSLFVAKQLHSIRQWNESVLQPGSSNWARINRASFCGNVNAAYDLLYSNNGHSTLVNVTRLLKLHRNHYLPRASDHSKGQPLLTCYFFHNLHVNTPHVVEITKSHPFQWILHKCHLTSTCSNGQYAAFSVNKMHISKIYILFPIKCTQTTHNSNKITSQNKYNNKTTFFA